MANCEAKLNQLISAISTLNTNLNTLNSAVSSMNTRINAISNTVSALEPNIIKSYLEHLIEDVNSLVTNTSDNPSNTQLIEKMSVFLGVVK